MKNDAETNSTGAAGSAGGASGLAGGAGKTGAAGPAGGTGKTGPASVKNDFSKGSVSGNIIRMAVPMTLAQLLNVLYNIVDRMYIGRIPGASTLALTGVGICFPIITLATAFCNLFGTGGAPLCSIARGAKDNEQASRIQGTSFFMLIVLGLIVTALLEIFQTPVLMAFGASGATYPYAAEYMRIYSAGTVFAFIGIGMNPFINAQGFAKIGMGTVAVGAVLNIVLDPLFIFVLHMGVRGAALATIISQAVSALWVIRFLTGKKAILRLEARLIRFDGPLVKTIVSLGLTGFFVRLTNSAVEVSCNRMLGLYGGDLYIGVMTVLTSIWTIARLPVEGITDGTKPVISFNYGAKEYDRVRGGIRFMTLLTLGVTAGTWLLLVIFPQVWISIFNTDPQMIAAGVPSLRLYYLGFVMMTFQFAGQATFVGLGKAKQAVFFSIFRKLIVEVPLVLILPRLFGLGVNGVFLAEPISDFVGGCACYTTMYFTVYRRLGRKDRQTDH